MMPVHRFMDPYNGSNVPYNQNHRPSFENFQPHMKGDPAMLPVPYEMPYANNLGYPVMPHSCCSHVYLPGHCGWRNSPPAYPYAPLNQFHYCGQHYPAFPQSYPVQYVPPYYTMNLPMYDFDKIVPGEHCYHCCGCPNHAHNKKSSDNVKVEEQEPDDERKNSNSLIPGNQLKNNSYPIIWIPPDYLKDKEHMKSDRSEDASRIKEKPVRETRPSESQRMNPSISDPRVGSVGVPLDLKNLGRLVGDSDGKKAQNHQNQDKKEQLPFPLIWIPYYDNKNNEEEMKDNKEPVAPKNAEDPASLTSFFPVKLAEGQDYSNGPVALDERNSSGQKSISVKQIEEPMVKAHSEDSMKSELKYQDNNVAEKVPGTNAKRQFSSPTKTLKLPPVCLRVDPLPKKKNGKVASRSPSPPGTNVQQEASKNQSSEHKESHQSFRAQDNNLGSEGKVEAKKKEGKVIPEVERRSSESEPQITVTPITDSERKVTNEKMEKQSEGVGKTEVATELVEEEESKTKEAAEIRNLDKCENKAGRKELSDVEAALRIQSAYRGFTVRRWEPLKKLKEIAKVRDKVAEVRNQIQTLESTFDPQKDGRQKLVIGETIMSLLLKLDTIQGLHPSFRDMRKSLARELITLQEKLDMLMVKKSEEMNETKAAENPIIDCNVQTREAEEQSSNISSKSDAKTNQISEPVIVKDENNTSEQEARSLPTVDELSIQKQEDVAGAGAVENPSMKCVPSECEAEASENSESAETRIIAPDISDSKGRSDKFEDESEDILTDLKQAVIEEESIEQEGAGATDGEIELPIVTEWTIADDNLISAKNTTELNPVNELPLGLIVEQDSEKDEMTKMEENESLCGEEATDFIASELPVAILDEDEPREEESSELQNEDSGGYRYEVESIEKVEKEDALIYLSEQQSMEPSTGPEMHSVAELEKVDGNTGHEVCEGDTRHPHAVDIDDSSRDVEATKLAGSELPSAIKNESNDELCEGEGSHISFQSHICDAANSNLEEDGQTKDDKNVPQRTIDDEKMSLKEQADALAENLRDANESVALENAEEESDTVSVSSPEYEERDQDTQVVPPAPADSQSSIKEQAITEKRILEENQQLKEMVEKLLEAGKEQLSVISSLTGRVKDLEKKLYRNKEGRLARFKVSPRSCGRQLNELQRSRAVRRAM